MQLGDAEFWQRLADQPALLAYEIASIDVANLDETLQRHSSLVAWLNATYELARIDQEAAEYEHTKAEARAVMKARESADAATGKAKIAQVLDAEAALNHEVWKAADLWRAAQRKCGALKAMSKALDHRESMLVQIAAKHRREWEAR